MLYSLRVTTTTSGTSVHLPFEIDERSTIVVRRVDCHLTGTGFDACERVELHLFGIHSGAISSNVDTSDVIVPTFGQAVTRIDQGFVLDLHHAQSRRCSPTLTLLQSNGTPAAGTVAATVFVLLDINESGKTQGTNAAANMRQINVPLSMRLSTYDGDEGNLKTVRNLPPMRRY